MARPHVPTCTTPHHMIPQVGNEPHGPSLEGQSLHATKVITSHAQPPQQRLHGQSPPRNAQHVHPPCFYAHTCHQRCHLQRSDRLVPHHIQSGQRIHCRIICLRCQLHLLGTHQEPVERRTHVCLPRNLRVVDVVGLQTPPSQNGQQDIARDRELHQIPTDSPLVYNTGHTLHKSGKTCDPHLEKSLPCRHRLPPQVLPRRELVQPQHTVRRHTKHAPSRSSKSPSISPRSA